MHKHRLVLADPIRAIGRLRFSGRTIEMTSTRLTRIFGPNALGDLYLKGRAVLRADQDLAVAERQLTRFKSHYQGDAVLPRPRFVQAA